MVSIEYPSSQWRDPHGPFEEGNVKRVNASLDAIDNDINGTGIITIIQENSIPTMRKNTVTEANIIKTEHRVTIHPSEKGLFSHLIYQQKMMM